MTTVDVPPDSPFGPANLPYGVFAPDGGGPRVGVRLGDHVIDLAAALGTRGSDAVLAAPTLNPLMAQGPAGWARLRERVTALADGDIPDDDVHPLASVALTLPFDWVLDNEPHLLSLQASARPCSAHVHRDGESRSAT